MSFQTPFFYEADLSEKAKPSRPEDAAAVRAFFFSLLDKQAAGKFEEGTRLLAILPEPTPLFASFLKALASSSFFAWGKSEVEIRLLAHPEAKRPLYGRLDKVVSAVRKAGCSLEGRFLEQGNLPIEDEEGERRPLIVFALERENVPDLSKAKAEVFLLPDLSSRDEEATMESYGASYARASAWLDAGFEGNAVHCPETGGYSPRPFLQESREWQKAYSALFHHYVRAFLAKRELLEEGARWFASFKRKDPPARYRLLKANYSIENQASSFERALHSLAEEEHRRWMIRTLCYADEATIESKRKQGMMVSFDQLVASFADAYQTSQGPSRDIIVYDYLDVLAAFDLLF